MEYFKRLPKFIQIIFIFILIGQFIIFIILNNQISSKNNLLNEKEIILIKNENENENEIICENKIICKNKCENINKENNTLPKSFQIIKEIDSEITRRCSERFGDLFIKNWRETQINICSGYGLSHIQCYKRENSPKPQLLCVAENSEIRGYSPYYIADSSDISKITHVEINKGFLHVDCDDSMRKWIPETEWEEKLNFVMGNMETNSDIKCEHWINHTVFWIWRWAEAVTYHFFEDFITVFFQLLVLNEDPQNVQPVFIDDIARGPQLYDFWSVLFGYEPKILRVDPFPKNTCFKKSIFGMSASFSIWYMELWQISEKKCKFPMLYALKNYIFERSNISFDNHIHKSPYTIAFVKRENYNGTIIKRTIPNYDNVSNYIEQKLPKNWKIVKFQPEKMTIPEQIQFSSNISIIIGPHGSALTYLLFMPEHSHLIEIFGGNRSPNMGHYKNICTYLNHEYHNAGYFNDDVSEKEIWSLVSESIQKIEEIKYQNQFEI
ncbi:beta-12-xylosyltransferase [Anaeramoeba ignava]|uniref:EGF domain-specific O-linked N-acetylglucosamine transferase n=1 Tax=Anaeramoeba ignava TaxID=1746090 RepID=A0A9Q0LN41_ANAIG|nr:beta-12-xylosyltransferase [Anaeramoeba ignava]